jgi:peptidylprolyl isomerase
MRQRILILPMLLAVLAFAACGDDKSADETAAAPTTEATEAPTEAPADPVPTEAPTEGAQPKSGDSGVKVTGDPGSAPKVEVPKGGAEASELIIEDIKKGKGPKAAPGQTVAVQYYGALAKDGTKFDASWDRGGEPFEFSLGAGMVIPGWDQGLVGMQEGGRRVLTIPSDLAYGDQGSGPIPPGSTLVFVVDMEKITSP